MQDFRKWMEDVVDSLQGRKSFISSVCVACCSLMCNVYQLKEEFVCSLLWMLRIQPNVNSRKCPNVSYLFSLCNNER